MNNGVSFGAVVFASAMNMVMVRKGEMNTGIDVTTEGGEHIGMSKVAATSAIKQTVLVRASQTFTIFFMPPVLTSL